MITVISPAKTLDFTTPPTTKTFSQPRFIKQAEKLAGLCKQMSPNDLSKLMGISTDLGLLNAERFRAWHLPFTPQNAKQALNISDRGYVLVTGENRYSGTGKELLDDPRVRSSFLGG